MKKCCGHVLSFEFVALRHVEQALMALIDEKMTETLRGHTTKEYVQLAAFVRNAKYMQCPGWYLVATMNWRGTTKQVQLSHSEFWTEQTICSLKLV